MSHAPPPHILVVNDDRPTIELYRDLLTDEGYRTTLRTLPLTDLREVEQLAPDAILLDFVIGGDDLGWRFLQRIKADPATSAIPILVCTAAVQAVTAVQDQLDAWDCGVVLKPFDIDDLLAQLRDCIDRAPRGANGPPTEAAS